MDNKTKTFHPVSSGLVTHLGKKISARIDGEVFAEGTWKDIKDTVKGKGGRYVSNEFALLELPAQDGKEVSYELVVFQLVGASLSAWFNKEGSGDYVQVTGTKEETTGSNTYKVPVFETFKLSPEQLAMLQSSEDVKAFTEYYESKDAGAEDEEEKKEEEVDIDDIDFGGNSTTESSTNAGM